MNIFLITNINLIMYKTYFFEKLNIPTYIDKSNNYFKEAKVLILKISH